MRRNFKTTMCSQADDTYMFECIEQFLTEKKSEGLSVETLKLYKNHLNTLNKLLGDYFLMSNYDKAAYNLFYEKLSSRDITSATVKSYCLSVRVFSYWAMEQGYCPEFGIPTPKCQSTIKQVYTDEELSKLLKKPNLRECAFTDYKIWVLENLAISIGLRIGSLLNIKIGDINFQNNSILVNKTKNKKGFTTYFNSEMAMILKEYLRYRGYTENEYLICTEFGTQLARRTAQQEVAKYNKSRGVNKTSLHLMRHTFAKNSVQAGLDVFTLMNKLQHKDISTTFNYVKSLGLDIQNTVDIYNPQKQFSVNHRKIDFRKRGKKK